MATFDNESTRLIGDEGNGAQPVSPNPAFGPVRKQKSGLGAGASIGIGAGAGVLIGGAAGVAIGALADNDNNPVEEIQGEVHDQNQADPSWAVGDIKVAQGVNDSMSFSEAFAAARAEVGPGGAFEWHGGVYGTYTKSEWNSMSSAEKSEYNDHFAWNQGHGSSHSHDTHTHYAEHHEVHHHHDVHHYYEEDFSQVDEILGDPVVEVLGVVHDDATGANYGSLSVDGQDVILVDVDGDMTFDYMASDFDHNGVYDDNEIVSIGDNHVTVDDLGGFVDGYVPGSEFEDGQDYSAGITIVDETSEFAAVGNVEAVEFTPEVEVDMPTPDFNDGMMDPMDGGMDAGMDADMGVIDIM